jgi:hypothetical protein
LDASGSGGRKADVIGAKQEGTHVTETTAREGRPPPRSPVMLLASQR